MNPGVSFRLILCLVMLHGWVDVSSEEPGGGFGENDSGEVPPMRDLTGQFPGVTNARIVAGCNDGNVEGDDGNFAVAAGCDRRATVPVVDRAHEAVEEAGRATATLGACDGRRFKKCR